MKRNRRPKPQIGRTRVAGRGNDGHLYGVTTVTRTPTGAGDYRKQVCATCPWRLDQPVGRFPAQAYRESAPTAYDAAVTTFSCHESGAECPQTCAGFLLANSQNNIAVRIGIAAGRFDPSKMKRTTPLYASYRAMAEANGVSVDDPVLRLCRGDQDR